MFYDNYVFVLKLCKHLKNDKKEPIYITFYWMRFGTDLIRMLNNSQDIADFEYHHQTDLKNCQEN
jgi:hypothetical protein